MEENKVIDMNVEEEIGQVQIADDVIAVIAEIAALEVEGIISVGAGKPDIVQSIRGKKASKGIRIEVSEDQVFVDIVGTVKYGVKIQDVCLKVQEKVKNSIETMTGLDVKAVDIRIAGVYFPKEKLAEEY
ncbi:MAG: Asp23/Gls24 family envelope stress response protein [Cellulosilyticaceae bacterium]